ncbi:BREX-1 system adenine-specific DNA-methyltransferase PglX [Clostridium estertheticum]|uniref:BREX-1 system adenine-specific DNA-methyltransferase PglX n=1 Tax=Clostridium estertheticum TaxID=238834 RepID=UPI001C7D5E1C|nr:BREX-1 system adenine-specific DNA-methyltransferase PglX [Clostridium estertheticum]MBX4261949.1 BREX-1 system adenine-specific DNA-methyltransferase PglX [Clostridium estertheticum]WLC68637.1 BREX-1 system adenine-specific DNA-methyltransferase PglX [Clostridium estertheticum]
MDKNKIKTYAIWARRKLISTVSERANRIGVTEKKIEGVVEVQGGFKLEGNDEIFKLSKDHRDKLVNQVNEKGFQQVMEEVAYTWFNRFMGLRYMEVNEYLPSGIRVLSSIVAGKIEPDVLTRVTEVIEELKLKPDYIYELLDSGKTEDRDEAYKHILVKQCNELGKIIPQMFEKISDYTELLLPDNLLEDGSVIRKMVEDIVEDNWKEEVEIIGWMYQYYISEKKDEVFAALKKNIKITKENIPAATQLFTPKWIVKYMVENSLGRLWLEGHPNEELQKQWKYYLEEADQDPVVEQELKKIREKHSKLKPEDIQILDPCMGSGHILVYAFDVLYEIYKTAGYSEREIPRKILQNNLYGLDIDDRAAQLSSFGLIMKARHYNRRLFREIEMEHLELNLCSIQESNNLTNGLGKEAVDYFVADNDELRKDINYLIDVFNDAKEYGSILEVKEVNFESLKERLNEIEKEYNLTFVDYKKMLLDELPIIIKQAEIMSRKYEVCITNPPYMGIKSMNNNLKKYLENNYNYVKTELYAVFIAKCTAYTKEYKYTAMITQHSWMFLSFFEKLRDELFKVISISTMAHLGSRAFEEISGEVVQSTSFVLRKWHNLNYKGIFSRLVLFGNCELKKENFKNEKNLYISSIRDFERIPSKIVAYWASNKIFDNFSNNILLGEFAKPRQGVKTLDNERFLKLWFEVNNSKIRYNIKTIEESISSHGRWFPYNKGGTYKKWYGNNEYVVNWENDGKEMKQFAMQKYNSVTRTITNIPFFFRDGLTWSAISSGSLSMRNFDNGFIFDSKGSSMFFDNNNDKIYILGLLNSKVADEFLKILSPTLDFNVGPISNVPIIKNKSKLEDIKELVENSISISLEEWNNFENSWDFKVHPLLKLLDKTQQYKLSAIFNLWETECEESFNQLKYNEEELNRIFINIYGLQDELTPELLEKDITIRKACKTRDIKSFISYAVGCMLGRYSNDIEGLIYAGGDFRDKWNLEDKKARKIENDGVGNIISASWVDVTFMPDSDNVIPITEDEYFEDDIVSRFIEFVRNVYSKETLEENLDFIADSIDRKPSETARQAIRRYFIKDFYKDHIKAYKKRPIYWMFESGKNDGFRALVYMHRYNPQTVAKVRTDYLHKLQRKYEEEVQRQQLIVDSEKYTVKDRTVAKKKRDRISKQIEECREYDQVVSHLANEKISIDLDDGVKVNYEKFQGVKLINSKEKEVKMNLLAKI